MAVLVFTLGQLAHAVDTPSPAPLPPLTLKNDITVETTTTSGGRTTRTEHASDFQEITFLSSTSDRYTAMIQFYEKDNELVGRFCKVTAESALTDCFSIEPIKNSSPRKCTLRKYDESKDFPTIPQGAYSQSDFRRAFLATGERREQVLQSLLRVNLYSPGKSSDVTFAPLTANYKPLSQISTTGNSSPTDLIKSRGEFACNYLMESGGAFDKFSARPSSPRSAPRPNTDRTGTAR